MTASRENGNNVARKAGKEWEREEGAITSAASPTDAVPRSATMSRARASTARHRASGTPHPPSEGRGVSD